MTAARPTPHADRPPFPAPEEVRVWDPLIRLLHWTLAAGVATAAVTGFLGPARWVGLHVAAGTTIAVVVFARIVWGFVGTRHARFADFLVGPRAVIAHLRELVAGTAPRRLGHNPLGAWMIVVLIVALAGLAASGVIVLAGVLKAGPLAFAVSHRVGEIARELHESVAVALLGLIAAHVAGALFESRRTAENLVRAMVTGRKRAARETHASSVPAARPLLAAAVVAATVLVVGVAIVRLSALPGLGVPRDPLPKAIAAECGACHMAYPPSLLPRASWRALLAGLDDHFGETATLPPDRRDAIAALFEAGAAETADTTAAHVFRAVAPDAPFTLGETPFWKRRHAALDPALFTTGTVAAKGDCVACHRDAATARFDPDRIVVPPLVTKGTAP